MERKRQVRKFWKVAIVLVGLLFCVVLQLVHDFGTTSTKDLLIQSTVITAAQPQQNITILAGHLFLGNNGNHGIDIESYSDKGNDVSNDENNGINIDVDVTSTEPQEYEPDGMCAELLERSKDTEDGQEPWRSSGGLLWTYRQCAGDSISELGIFLSRWYMARAIASAAGVTIQLDCRSPATEWIPQYLEQSEAVLDDRAKFSWKEACQSDSVRYPHKSPLHGNGLDHLASAIRSDLRNMTQIILSKSPWLVDDLDDAVIHLRTDDIGRSDNSNYGLVPFHVFTSLIPNTAKTIGVITAPSRQNKGDTELNKVVSMAARDYIQRKFPDARVSVRNVNVNETMAMAYVRMVAAKWSFCGSSTFCLYPALATAGKSYILQSPLHGRSPGWLDRVAESFKNVNLIEGKVIFSNEFREWNTSDTVKTLQRSIEMIAWYFDKSRMRNLTHTICSELLKRANGTEEGHEPWRASRSPLLLHIRCSKDFSESLGNHFSRWYLARAIASAAGVTIQADCRSAVTDWIPQYWEPSKTVLENRASFSWKEACLVQDRDLAFPHQSALKGNGLHHMVSAIRSDLRNMTQAILSKNPWLADDLDEAVIHIRVGDIGRRDDPRYGLIPFRVYTSRIPNTTKTIGVITAPYRQDRRGKKLNDVELNEAVTVAAKNYIQRSFPDARVSIRNDDVNETMAMTYVRMVAAKWSFCGASTFCLYPALATAGESYIQRSLLYGHSPGWLDKVTASFENIHYSAGKIITSSKLRLWNTTKIVKILQGKKSIAD